MWRNGRREGLKILYYFIMCGFKSHHRYIGVWQNGYCATLEKWSLLGIVGSNPTTSFWE